VKPTDEEPLAPNNPKGFVGKAPGQPGLKRSVRRQGSGEWQHTFLTMITLLMCPYIQFYFFKNLRVILYLHC